MADNASTKKPKPKAKIIDIAPPKKAASGDPHIVINARPMIGRNISVSTPLDESTEPEPKPAAPQLTAARRPVIAPLNAAEVTPDKNTAAKADDTTAEEKPAAPKENTPEPAATPSVSVEDSEDDKPEADASEVTTDDEAVEAPIDDSESTTRQPNAETRKAVEEAKRAAKRQEELEKYIDSKEFFVPINAVARKRSIKVSALLTILVLLLALILIDLMIDSGVILLVQKIPHTHFFTSN